MLRGQKWAQQVCTCGWGLIRGPSVSIILPYPSGLESQCLHCLPVGCGDPFHMNPKKEGVVNKSMLFSRLFYFLIGGKLLHNVLLVSSGRQCKSVISNPNRVPLGRPWQLSGGESACQCRRLKRHGFDPRLPGLGNGNPLQYLPGKIPWAGAWQGTAHGVVESDSTE